MLSGCLLVALGVGLLAGFVDPCDGRQLGEVGSAGEPLGVGGPELLDHGGTPVLDGVCGPDVDGEGRVHSDTGMVMLVIVVFEEPVTEPSCVLDRTESFRKHRTILECFEVCLTVGVVVADLRPGM